MRLWVIGLMLAAVLTGCGEPKKQTAQEEAEQHKKHLQDYASQIVNDIMYIKDPRTGICYAYCWGGGANGGPSLAAVPEEKIPKDLLITGQIAKK